RPPGGRTNGGGGPPPPQRGGEGGARGNPAVAGERRSLRHGQLRSGGAGEECRRARRALRGNRERGDGEQRGEGCRDHPAHRSATSSESSARGIPPSLSRRSASQQRGASPSAASGGGD